MAKRKTDYEIGIESAAQSIADQIRSKYGSGWGHIGETAQENAIAAAVMFGAFSSTEPTVDVQIMRDQFVAAKFKLIGGES